MKLSCLQKGGLSLVFLFFNLSINAQEKQFKWYDKFSIGGYTQVRYNRLLETNPNLKCEQCDKSIGKDGGIFIRRARVRIQGDVSNRLFMYLQYDMAIANGSSNATMLGLRDAYFDLAFDDKKRYRIRFGQSKVPFGFENMQSSSNRLALDRNDAINSAAKDERDIGAFFMLTPPKIRENIKTLTNSGLKGSGDYGMLNLGVYNGQGAGRPEANDNLHVVGRITYPHKFPNGQFVEASLQAYTGRFNITNSSKNLEKNTQWDDKRVGLTAVVYPQPLGIQAEYNLGKGPEFNTVTSKTEIQNLKGGYVQAMYRKGIKEDFITGFVKYQYYDGGKKFETDARSYLVKDTEIGIEWIHKKYVELTTVYMISKRRFEDGLVPINNQKGNTLRLQLQFNY